MVFFKRIILAVFVLFSMLTGSKAQAPAGSPRSSIPGFDEEIARLLKFSVPLVSVDELRKNKNKYTLLDAREPAEFAVSHIPDARNIGFDKLDESVLKGLAKDAPLLLYCSIGYRSEIIAEKLKSRGYSKVYNLYGSIFEWANKGFPLETNNGKSAKALHTYNQEWSKWIINPEITKKW